MGFIGKFYLLNQAVISQSWWLIAGLVIGSGIGLAYYLPIIFSLFKYPAKELSTAGSVPRELGFNPQLFMVILIVLSFYFGLFPDSLSQFIQV